MTTESMMRFTATPIGLEGHEVTIVGVANTRVGFRIVWLMITGSYLSYAEDSVRSP